MVVHFNWIFPKCFIFTNNNHKYYYLVRFLWIEFSPQTDNKLKNRIPDEFPAQINTPTPTHYNHAHTNSRRPGRCTFHQAKNTTLEHAHILFWFLLRECFKTNFDLFDLIRFDFFDLFVCLFDVGRSCFLQLNDIIYSFWLILIFCFLVSFFRIPFSLFSLCAFFFFYLKYYDSIQF